MNVIQNYTLTLNFVKTHRHLKIILIYNVKQFMLTENNSKKSSHILDDHASGAQIRDIEQVTL
jgi:hypothetical protein